MSVYLNSGMVLLDSGSVATSTDCCCGSGACCDTYGSCTITTEADCDGEYQGDGTVCDPNPCFAFGACCNGIVCTINNFYDCETVGGGVYQGDGTVCEPNPCVDCGTDSIMLCKCGIPAFEGFGSSAYYLHREFHVVRHEVLASPFTACTSDWDFTTINQFTVESDGSCSVACDCSGGGTEQFTGDFSWVPGGFGTCGDDNFGAGCHGTDSGPVGCSGYCLTASGIGTDGGGPVSATESILTCSEHEFSGLDVDFTETITLSDEYTTAMLITNAEALFVATYGDCSSGCELHSELNGDESCVTITCVASGMMSLFSGSFFQNN